MPNTKSEQALSFVTREKLRFSEQVISNGTTGMGLRITCRRRSEYVRTKKAVSYFVVFDTYISEGLQDYDSNDALTHKVNFFFRLKYIY